MVCPYISTVDNEFEKLTEDLIKDLSLSMIKFDGFDSTLKKPIRIFAFL